MKIDELMGSLQTEFETKEKSIAFESTQEESLDLEEDDDDLLF